MLSAESVIDSRPSRLSVSTVPHLFDSSTVDGCGPSGIVVMAESSLSRRRPSRPSLRNRMAHNVQGFLFFMTLWSTQSTTAILRQRNTKRTSYKIKRGHVRYANKWIPLDKFQHLQVLTVARCPSSGFFQLFFQLVQSVHGFCFFWLCFLIICCLIQLVAFNWLVLVLPLCTSVTSCYEI